MAIRRKAVHILRAVGPARQERLNRTWRSEFLHDWVLLNRSHPDPPRAEQRQPDVPPTVLSPMGEVLPPLKGAWPGSVVDRGTQRFGRKQE